MWDDVNIKELKLHYNTVHCENMLLTLHRMCTSMHLDDRTVEKVFHKHGGVDGGRHEDDAHIGVSLDHISQNYQQEIRLDRKTIVNIVRQDTSLNCWYGMVTLYLHLSPSHGFHPRSHDWCHGYQIPASSAKPLLIRHFLAISPSPVLQS